MHCSVRQIAEGDEEYGSSCATPELNLQPPTPCETPSYMQSPCPSPLPSPNMTERSRSKSSPPKHPNLSVSIDSAKASSVLEADDSECNFSLKVKVGLFCYAHEQARYMVNSLPIPGLCCSAPGVCVAIVNATSRLLCQYPKPFHCTWLSVHLGCTV